jgi:hypothetical protein
MFLSQKYLYRLYRIYFPTAQTALSGLCIQVRFLCSNVLGEYPVELYPEVDALAFITRIKFLAV